MRYLHHIWFWPGCYFLMCFFSCPPSAIWTIDCQISTNIRCPQRKLKTSLDVTLECSSFQNPKILSPLPVFTMNVIIIIIIISVADVGGCDIVSTTPHQQHLGRHLWCGCIRCIMSPGFLSTWSWSSSSSECISCIITINPTVFVFYNYFANFILYLRQFTLEQTLAPSQLQRHHHAAASGWFLPPSSALSLPFPASLEK